MAFNLFRFLTPFIPQTKIESGKVNEQFNNIADSMEVIEDALKRSPVYAEDVSFPALANKNRVLGTDDIGKPTFLNLMSSPSDTQTNDPLMRRGAFGVGKSLDLRLKLSEYDTPAKCYEKGLVSGFADSASLGITTPHTYGVLTIDAQYFDASGLASINRRFTTIDGEWLSTPASATAWGAWKKVLYAGDLGSAAQLTATVSHADSTPGRALRTWDFGLGGRGVLVNDANAITASGIYAVGSSWVGSVHNGVDGANQGYLTHEEWSGAGYALQRFTDVNSTFITRERRKNDGVWSNWTAILKRGDYGLGDYAVPSSNLNEYLYNGVYRMENPGNGINYSPCLNLNSNDGRTQLLIDRLGKRMAFRGVPSGDAGFAAWQPWREVVWEGNKGISSDPYTLVAADTVGAVGVDFNTLTNAGYFYRAIILNSSSNRPPSGMGATGYVYLEVRSLNANEIQQIVYDYPYVAAAGGVQDPVYTWSRTRNAGSWSQWQQISAPAIGQVGFANGINTGAHFERGSNPNGQFEKRADATMTAVMQFGSPLSVAPYAPSAGLYVASFVWTFPAQFKAGNQIVVTGSGVDNVAAGWVSAVLTSANTATIYYFTTTSNVTASNISLTAIGTWR